MNPGMILVQRSKEIDDPRITGRCAHALVDILVIALCATMAGAEGWDDMEAWGEANEERLRLYLELRNGIPGHDTIRRVFEAIDPKRIEAVLLEWIGNVCPMLGQQRCDEKSNEVTAIEALLPNLALAGCIVTIDAMGCNMRDDCCYSGFPARLMRTNTRAAPLFDLIQ